jgi:hypothetical protein
MMLKRVGLLGACLCLMTACSTWPSQVAMQPNASGFFAAQASQDPLQGALLVNGLSNGLVQAGQPATWAFHFVDRQTKKPLTQFTLDDTKYMHLVAVSADLDTFAHIHPALANDGTFQIGINQPSSDPDNFMAPFAAPKPGAYLLFADVTPQGQSTQLARFGAMAAGQAHAVPLQLDPVNAAGDIEKFFTADSRPGHPGDPYKVTLKIGKMTQGMPMVNLGFNIQRLAPTSAGQAPQYTDVTDLQSWLGMPGHCIVISQSGQTAQDKVFLHLHAGMQGPMMSMGMGPMKPITGPNLNFMAMGQEMPPAGIYKLWCQTERQGAVLTFPFVVKL